MVTRRLSLCQIVKIVWTNDCCWSFWTPSPALLSIALHCIAMMHNPQFKTNSELTALQLHQCKAKPWTRLLCNAVLQIAMHCIALHCRWYSSDFIARFSNISTVWVVNCPSRWSLSLLSGYLCRSSIFHNPDDREIQHSNVLQPLQSSLSESGGASLARAHYNEKSKWPSTCGWESLSYWPKFLKLSYYQFDEWLEQSNPPPQKKHTFQLFAKFTKLLSCDCQVLQTFITNRWR